MDEDPKLKFYLQRRDQIEEWASLRRHAAAELDRALGEATQAFLSKPDRAHCIQRTDWGGTHLFVPVSSSDRIGFSLWWKASDLFKPDAFGVWPVLAITVLDGKHDPARAAVKEATATARHRHGMDTSGPEWVWRGRLAIESGSTDLEQFASDCLAAFLAAWTDLGPMLDEALPSVDPAPIASSGTAELP